MSDIAVCNLAYEGKLEMIEKYLKENRSKELEVIDITGRTILHWACSGGHLDLIKFILNNPLTLDINRVDEQGWSALMIAVSAARPKIVEELLKRSNIDVNICEKNGRSAIVYAISKNQKNIIDMLLLKNVSVDVVDNYGYNLIHRCVMLDNLELTEQVLRMLRVRKLLIDSINKEDNEKKTPLLMAVQIGNVDMCALLIENRAKMELIDTEHLEELDKLKMKEIGRLLQERSER
ncbi:hypothetical protein SNEBB_006431 [Seison nebaliae]|nr:hypothetical protein SNEBB_006431 [Seison nebaliae]